MELPEKQATVTRDVQLVKKRIRELDQIFGKATAPTGGRRFVRGQ
jgi:hypothetical protein